MNHINFLRLGYLNISLPTAYTEALSYLEGVRELQKKINETITVVNQHSEEITTFNHKIDEVVAIVTGIEKMICDLYNPEYNYRVGDYTIENKKLYRCIEITTGEFDSTKWEEINIIEIIKEIDERINDIDDEISIINANVLEINSDITIIRNNLSDIASELNSTVTRLSTAETKISALEIASQSHDQAIGNLETGLATAQGNIRAVETEVQTNSNNISALDTRVSNTESNITILQNNVRSIDTELSQQSAEIVALDNRTTNAETNITGLNSRVTTAETKINALETASQSHDQAIGNLETGLATAQANIRAVETEVQTNSNNISALDTRVDSLENITQSHDQEIGNLKDNIARNFNPNTIYNAGDYCLRNGILKKCRFNNVTGTYNDNDWETINITDEFINNNTDKGQIYTRINAGFDMIAEMYDVSATYNVGDLVIYEETLNSPKLYRCINAVTIPELFDNNSWAETTISDELKRGGVNPKITSLVATAGGVTTQLSPAFNENIMCYTMQCNAGGYVGFDIRVNDVTSYGTMTWNNDSTTLTNQSTTQGRYTYNAIYGAGNERVATFKYGIQGVIEKVLMIKIQYV